MCRFCRSFNFGDVGYKYDFGKPVVFFPSHAGGVPEDNRFSFCPVCGQELVDHAAPTCSGCVHEARSRDEDTCWDCNRNPRRAHRDLYQRR